MNKLNESRENPAEFQPGDTIYIKSKERHKAKPKFSDSKVINDENAKVTTQKGTHRKSTLKKPRKSYKNLLLQENVNDKDENENSPDLPNPNSDKGNTN